MKQIVALLLPLLIAVSAVADMPPRTAYIYPPAVTAGTTVEVSMGGFDFTPDIELLSHHRQVSLKLTSKLGKFLVAPPPYWFGPKGRSGAFPVPREFKVRVTVPKNAKPGPAFYQVTNANGVSGILKFQITAKPDVLEQRDRDKPQVVSVPATISGRVFKIAEVDKYLFKATADGLVTANLFARRIGSNFNGYLTVVDDTGKMLVDSVDTRGVDTAATFAVKAGRSYTVGVADVDFRGNRTFVYRLRLTPGPRILTTVPTVLKRGTTQRVKVIGYGVKTGAAKVEVATASIVIPKAATTNFATMVNTPGGKSTAKITTGSRSDLTSNGKASQALSIPSAISGLLGKSRSTNYTIQVKKGEHLQLD